MAKQRKARARAKARALEKEKTRKAKVMEAASPARASRNQSRGEHVGSLQAVDGRSECYRLVLAT